MLETQKVFADEILEWLKFPMYTCDSQRERLNQKYVNTKSSLVILSTFKHIVLF